MRHEYNNNPISKIAKGIQGVKMIAQPGRVRCYVVAGLTLDTTSGAISGTPTAATSSDGDDQ
jgi:hypothetical protein